MEEGSSEVKPDCDVIEDGVVKNGGSGARSAQVSPNSALTCEMCQNYEVNLTLIQENERKAREKLRAAKSLADRYEVELATERKYRVDVEKKMSELAAHFNDELKCAASTNAKIEERVNELLEKQKSGMEKCSEQLQDVNRVCSGYEEDMKQIAAKYQDLLGTNRTTAAEMRAEPIDLPQNADQLQFLCLQMREELIELKSARQHEQNDMRDEIALL
ncbi:hypothetical protein OSTOST_02748, partial [Ostertagia ostertagi]